MVLASKVLLPAGILTAYTEAVPLSSAGDRTPSDSVATPTYTKSGAPSSVARSFATSTGLSLSDLAILTDVTVSTPDGVAAANPTTSVSLSSNEAEERQPSERATPADQSAERLERELAKYGKLRRHATDVSVLHTTPEQFEEARQSGLFTRTETIDGPEALKRAMATLSPQHRAAVTEIYRRYNGTDGTNSTGTTQTTSDYNSTTSDQNFEQSSGSDDSHIVVLVVAGLVILVVIVLCVMACMGRGFSFA